MFYVYEAPSPPLPPPPRISEYITDAEGARGKICKIFQLIMVGGVGWILNILRNLLKILGQEMYFFSRDGQAQLFPEAAVAIS